VQNITSNFIANCIFYFVFLFVSVLLVLIFAFLFRSTVRKVYYRLFKFFSEVMYFLNEYSVN